MPQEALTEAQIFSLLLAAVTRTEAKVDLLLHSEAEKRAAANGTTVEEEAAIMDNIVGDHAENQWSKGLDSTAPKRQYTGS